MKRSVFILFCLMSSLVFQAQTATEIIQQYFSATGGKDLWNKLQSIQYAGVYVLGPGAEAPVKQAITFKPLCFASSIAWMGMKSKTVVQGDSGWTYDPFQGKRTIDPIPSENLKSYLIASNTNYLLLYYASKNFSADYLGPEDVEGVETHKVRLMSPDGDKFYFYFDTKTSYLLKYSSCIKLSNREEKQYNIYSDFRKTSYGLIHPYQVQSVDETGKEQGGPILLKTVDLNASIDQSLFAKP